jgi:hypothetical protein
MPSLSSCSRRLPQAVSSQLDPTNHLLLVPFPFPPLLPFCRHVPPFSFLYVTIVEHALSVCTGHRDGNRCFLLLSYEGTIRWENGDGWKGCFFTSLQHLSTLVDATLEILLKPRYCGLECQLPTRSLFRFRLVRLLRRPASKHQSVSSPAQSSVGD